MFITTALLMDIKVEIKEEPYLMDFCSPYEKDICYKEFVKTEGVTSNGDCDIDIKREIEEETINSNFYSVNQGEYISEGPILRFNKSSKDDVETKTEIKKEEWLLDTASSGTQSIYDNIKEEKHEDLYCIKSPGAIKESVSNYMSDLFCNEDLENVINLNTGKDGYECESVRRCQSQEGNVTYISTIETRVSTETLDGGESVNTALLQQSNRNKRCINEENCEADYRKVYECNICEKAFNHVSSLKSHKLGHEGIKPHKCNICDKAFTQLSSLKKHILIHEGIKPHKCDICHKAFTDLSNFKKHKLFHEGIKPYKCDICDKAFSQLKHLKKHKLMHEGIKPHKCDICDKAVTDLSSLKRHKLMHESIKPHKCNICDKEFIRLYDLKRHKLIHEEIKRYKCEICGKAVADFSSFKRHKLIHEGIKPHKCTICDKSFIRLQHLKRHKLIHKG